MPAGVSLRSLDPATRWNRVRRAVELAAQTRANIVVAIDPELWAPVLAAQRARGGLAIADVHEDFAALATDHDRWGPAVTRNVVALGSSGLAQTVARFDAVVVADEHLPPHRARWRIVGRNVPDPDDYDIGGRTTPGRRAVYAGDLTPQRGLQTMLDGVLSAPDWLLDLYGPDRPWARSAIEVAERASEGRIRYRGLVSQQELNAELPNYDVGLCLLDRIPSYDAALPAKILEYQAAGLATIATDLPRVADEVTSTDSGVVLPTTGGSASADQLAAALDGLGSAPDRIAALQRNARAAAEAHRPMDSLAQAVSMLTILLETP